MISNLYNHQCYTTQLEDVGENDAEFNTCLLKIDNDDEKTQRTEDFTASDSESSSTCSFDDDNNSIQGDEEEDVESGALLLSQQRQENGRNETRLKSSCDNRTDHVPDGMKLLIGAGGIYAAFIYYGSLQEDVFRYQSENGTFFTQAWFLSVIESFSNVIVGYIGMKIAGATPHMPLNLFAISGAAQVSSKAFTSLALTHGLSYPVALLVKSSKMAPVMAGNLILDGTYYKLREYIQVLAIIGGSLLVSIGGKKTSSSSSPSSSSEHSSNSWDGVFFITVALVFCGITAGFQKRIQTETAMKGHQPPKPYDFMFWTSVFMMVTATMITLVLGEFQTGIPFCLANSALLSKIVQFAIVSAIGQSFVFYTLAHFDPLVLSTVTTSRKIFSVLLSILVKGNKLTLPGWIGIVLACGGILSEFYASARKMKNKKKTSLTTTTTTLHLPCAEKTRMS